MNSRSASGRVLPRQGATALVATLLLATGSSSFAQPAPQGSMAGAGACTGDNGGITLSPGFCATVFADHLGHVRHMAVASNGVVYANTWSGRYYGNDTPPPGGMLIALKDAKGDWPG